MYLILVSFYFTLYLSCAVVLVLRARQWRQHSINPDCRKWLIYPFFGMLASFLYALWDLYPRTEILAFWARALHRFASSISSVILLVLLIQNYGDFRINQSRFRLFSLLLLGLSLVILLTTPFQIILAIMYLEPLPDHDLLNLIFHTLFEFIRWSSLVIKVLLLVIAIVLKIKDYALSGSSMSELANWLVLGSALVLLQEPWLVQTCLGNTIRAARTTLRIHAIVDPALFALLHECFAGIGYWQRLVDEGEDEESNGSSNPLLEFKRTLEGGLRNVLGV